MFEVARNLLFCALQDSVDVLLLSFERSIFYLHGLTPFHRPQKSMPPIANCHKEKPPWGIRLVFVVIMMRHKTMKNNLTYRINFTRRRKCHKLKNNPLHES